MATSLRPSASALSTPGGVGPRSSLREPVTPLLRTFRTESGGTAPALPVPVGLRGDSRHNGQMKQQTALTGALLLSLTCRVVACFASFSVIVACQLPPAVYVFFTSAAAAVGHLVCDTGLVGWTVRLRHKAMLVAMHAAWQSVSMVMWATALYRFHPLHVVVGEYFEYLIVAICATLAKRGAAVSTPTGGPPPAPPTQGGLLRLSLRFCVSLVLLVVAHAVFEEPEYHSTSKRSRQDTLGGVTLLVLYCISEVFRKSYKVWLVREVGSSTSVQAASTCFSALLLLPLLFLYSAVAPEHVFAVFRSVPHLAALFANALLALLLPAYLSARYPYAADLRGRLAGGSTQCALACTLAWLCHFFMAYKEDDSPVSLKYTALLLAAFAAQCWALRAAQRALQRQAPSSIDPFADYDIAELDELLMADRAAASALADSGPRRRLLVLLVASAFYAAVLILLSFSQGSAALLHAALRVSIGAVGVAISLHATAQLQRSSRGSDQADAHSSGRHDVVAGLVNGVLAVCTACWSCVAGADDDDWAVTAAVGEIALALFGAALSQAGGSSIQYGMRTQLLALDGTRARCLTDAATAAASAAHHVAAAAGMRALWAPLHLSAAASGVAAAAPVLRGSTKILMQSVGEPQVSQIDAALQTLRAAHGVKELRGTQFWMMSPGTCVGSLRVVVARGTDSQQLLQRARTLMRPVVDEKALTVQIEAEAQSSAGT